MKGIKDEKRRGKRRKIKRDKGRKMKGIRNETKRVKNETKGVR